MNKEEIYEAIKDLAMSQGSYGRLLRELNDEDLDFLEKQNFKDVVDLILFIEG